MGRILLVSMLACSSFAAQAQTSPCSTPGAVDWLTRKMQAAVPGKGLPIMWKSGDSILLSNVIEVVEPLHLLDTPGGHPTDRPAVTACNAEFKTRLVVGRDVDHPPAHIYNLVAITFTINYTVEEFDNGRDNAQIVGSSTDFKNLSQTYKLDKVKQ